MRGRKTAHVKLAPGDGKAGIERSQGGSNKRGGLTREPAPFRSSPPGPLSLPGRGNYRKHRGERGKCVLRDRGGQQTGAIAAAARDLRAPPPHRERRASEQGPGLAQT